MPLTASPSDGRAGTDTAHGIVAMLWRGTSCLWLEFGEPRRVSTEDTQLVTALVGHLSLAMQHVRQFEHARETSLTLQRSMLVPTDLPAGFAVRYEPAVSPLEIGGDLVRRAARRRQPHRYHRRRLRRPWPACGRGDGSAARSARALLLTGAEPATCSNSSIPSRPSFQMRSAPRCSWPSWTPVRDPDVQQRRTCPRGARRAAIAATTVDGCQSVPLAVHRDEPRPQAVVPLAAGSTLYALHRRAGRAARRIHRCRNCPHHRGDDGNRRPADRRGRRRDARKTVPHPRIRRRRRDRAVSPCRFRAGPRKRCDFQQG